MEEGQEWRFYQKEIFFHQSAHVGLYKFNQWNDQESDNRDE